MMRSSGTRRGKKASGSDNADGPGGGVGEFVLYGTYGVGGSSWDGIRRGACHGIHCYEGVVG